MSNLWPTNLLGDVPAGHSLSDRTAIRSCLVEQALGLETRTFGRVRGEVRAIANPSGSTFDLFIYPAGQLAMGYQFLILRSPDGTFPVAVEVFHLGEKLRINHANSLKDLEKTFKIIFADDASRRIIRTLADESHHSSASLNHEFSATREKPREIVFGGLFDQGGKSYATVSIFGLTGFLEEEQVWKIAHPSRSASLIEQMNDKFVLTVRFVDSVKLTITAEEADTLRVEALKSLGRR